MTDTKQPEALRLAAWLKAGGFINMTIDDTVAIVNELVTQHEQIADLEAIGGVKGLRSAPVLDRAAFERAALKDKPDRNIGSVEGLYFSPWVQAAWTGFKFAAAIAQEGGK